MENPWIIRLDQQLGLSQEAKTRLSSLIQKKQAQKGETIIAEGQVCHRLYFLETGLVRGFYYQNGKEITHWFGFESDIVTSFKSFIGQEASTEHLQAVEDCVFWTISRKDLYDLYDEFHTIERLGRITCEQYYLRLEERYVNSQFQTAQERYQKLIDHAPHILQRVPLGQVASYLGISQETLSRVRSRRD